MKEQGLMKTLGNRDTLTSVFSPTIVGLDCDC